MNIDDFIERLCLGELSNLYLGEQGLVDLHPTRRMKIINYTNQGLKILCSRFQLVKRELIVVGKENVSLYPLRREHSMRRGTSNFKFIDDSYLDPFRGDLIKILEVRNEVGMLFPLNDIARFDSIFTPTYDTLQINHPTEDRRYFVIYQALHPKLSLDDRGWRRFNIPPMLEEALALYVASKVYDNMNGEANKATAKEFMNTFESKCLEAMSLDMTAESSIPTHTKAEQKGFI